MTYQASQSKFLRAPSAVLAEQTRPSLPAARRAFCLLTLGMTMMAALTVAAFIAEWTVWAILAMALVVPSLLWISGGAATALTGLLHPAVAAPAPPHGWQPGGQTAVLVLLCREEPQAVARRLMELSRQIKQAGLGPFTKLIVLSDTFGTKAILEEEAALGPLIESGLIRYRRRLDNGGRKPGNIAEWFDREGQSYAQMLVLDADSRVSGTRIARMIWRMESQPALGLLQAGMALAPARSRFGQVQRTASRLLGPPFAAGLASWAADTANYWGHNALIRTAAFASAAHLPRLSGPAPFGGDILSHDFVEAAVIRRAGWTVEFDPDPAGSAEDGPQQLAEFHRRNRRWCQGNLQHIRLIGWTGLHPLSRLHIASGIFSFLAAPVWLALVVLMGSGLVMLESGLPFILILAVLIVPKLCGAWRLAGPRSTAWRRRVTLRAFGGELALSSLLAPIVMLHHSAAVLSVLSGRDCGWKGPERTGIAVPQGVLESLAGLALVALVITLNPSAAVWIVPVAGPMIAAPLLIRWMDAVRPEISLPRHQG
ncbi:MAG: glucans biosynthesis glucosyltransferase MdoH [Paracoccaceae bacterium]|nr:glucans biosynthesis glucosyltransferase MdoH [Paracoccaceae bacterium]